MPPLTLNGIVTKAGFMNKTVTVTVSRWVVHKLTGKTIERSKKYLVHDDNNQLRQDDVVLIQNCRPLSASKRFKLHKLLTSPETERDIARSQKESQLREMTSRIHSAVHDSLANGRQQKAQL